MAGSRKPSASARGKRSSQRGALLRELLVRLRREGETNGRGGGSVDVERASYLLEASAGNVALASGLYWEVRP